MWSTGAWACTYAHKVITVQNVPKSLCIHDCVHAFEWSYGYLMPTSGDIIIVTYEDHFLWDMRNAQMECFACAAELRNHDSLLIAKQP